MVHRRRTLAQAMSPVGPHYGIRVLEVLTRSKAPAVFACVLLTSCHSQHADDTPSIRFTRVPQADRGGKEKNDIIEGVVTGGRAGQQIVLYANSGNRWWVQPLVSHPFTAIQKNSGWTNATHLG